jgi:hypothetical protein
MGTVSATSLYYQVHNIIRLTTNHESLESLNRKFHQRAMMGLSHNEP